MGDSAGTEDDRNGDRGSRPGRPPRLSGAAEDQGRAEQEKRNASGRRSSRPGEGSDASGMQDELFDTDTGHDDAECERQVAVDEQVVPFVGRSLPLFGVRIVAFLQFLSAVNARWW